MFKSGFDYGVEVVHEILHGLKLFGGAYEGQEDFIYEPLPERYCPDKGFPDMKKMAYGGAALVPMAMPTSWRKCQSMNKRFLFLRMVSSNTPIVWGLEATGGRV